MPRIEVRALKDSGESLRVYLDSELEATKAESGAVSKRSEVMGPLQEQVVFSKLTVPAHNGL
jgi:hypothetical protein